MNWVIQETKFCEEQIFRMGNRMLCGNGYLGIRGTQEEYRKEQMPAINLAGIYDQVGSGWREPLNAPNVLYTYIVVDGKKYALPETEPLEHLMELDFRHGIFSRETSWKADRGVVTVRSERFACKDEVHRIAMRYSVTADFHAEIELCTGIDGDVWDIHGPHYDTLESSEEQDSIRMRGITHENGDTVEVLETVTADFPCEQHLAAGEKQILRRIAFVTEIGRKYCIEKTAVVFTSKNSGWNLSRAHRALQEAKTAGYDALKKLHCRKWEEKWAVSEVEIDGDEEAMKALNYSIYHLLSIAPSHAKNMSIPARGLSGQTYKGAIFWDTEMFMLDFFLFTDPDVARSLMKYRVDTLGGAMEKAAFYGYEGAFYAWESQEGGFDACSDYNVTDVFTGRPQRTYFKDKQYHISAAVVYGIMRYTQITGDRTLLREGGLKTVVECANFYYSLLLKKVAGDCYEIRDVIGPDEYHERVNNNAYTNRMAKFVFQSAAELLKNLEREEAAGQKERAGQEAAGQKERAGQEAAGQKERAGQEAAGRKERAGQENAAWKARIEQEYRVGELIRRFEDAAAHIYLPSPDEEGIIEQFDGYSRLEDATIDEVRGRLLHEKEYWGGAYGVAAETKVIKQADVVTMLNLFPEGYEPEILKKNWEYYEPRTEHGSSLSACMYAMLACKFHMPQKAYPFFMDSARADLRDGGKEWAGLVYIGGTHPAAAGGAYMTAVEGFGGVSVEDGTVRSAAVLPEGWNRMKFHICCRNIRYAVEIGRQETKITEEGNVHSDALSDERAE